LETARTLALALAPVVQDVVDDADRVVVTASGGGVVRELLEEDIGDVSEPDESVDTVEQEVLLEGVGMKRPRQAASYNALGCSWNRRNKSKLSFGQMSLSAGLVGLRPAISRAVTASDRSSRVAAVSS